MLVAQYALMPLYMMAAHGGPTIFDSYLTGEQLEFAQLVNVCGVCAMFIGLRVGSGSKRLAAFDQLEYVGSSQRERLATAATVVGILGAVAFFAVLPGLGGWNESGYIRDSYLITLPALLWLMALHRGERLSPRLLLLIVLIATPLLALGFLSARRGPTFMALVGLGVGWYVMRKRRPALLTLFGAGAALGTLVLWLVANRSTNEMGDYRLDFETLQRGPFDAISIESDNEFILGAGQIVTYNVTGEFSWGRQYIIDFLVRPIPRQLWPTKYEDAVAWLGIEYRLWGQSGGAVDSVLYWTPPVGAATGIVADLWFQFSWFFIIAIFLLGWAYGRTWRNAVSRGGPWTPIFGVMTALSIYLIWQNLEAMGFRLLLMLAASWIIWRYGIRGNSRAKIARSNIKADVFEK